MRFSPHWPAPTQVRPTSSRRPIFIERVYEVLSHTPRPLMLAIAGFGHYVMESRMLRGIKRRAEA